MLVSHRVSGLVPVRFHRRPNRFIAHVELLEDACDGAGRWCRAGEEVVAHVPDPGRLVELLVPGVRAWIGAAPGGRTRKTAWTLLMVESPQPPHALVSLDTPAGNRLAARLLETGTLDLAGLGLVGGPGPVSIRREVTRGRSRFDFLLERTRGARTERTFVEVKSVTLVADGVGRFPDAPTTRGQRHVAELIERAAEPDTRGAVLFVVQRDDAREVRPHPVIDPELARLLAEAAEAGVALAAVRFGVDESGYRYRGTIPVRARDTGDPNPEPATQTG